MLSLATESDAEISRYLGHANPSTLGRLREGQSFLDSESLARLGRFEIRTIALPNLHWVITGDGEPLLPTSNARPQELDALCVLARSEAVRLAIGRDLEVS